ncbi:Homing endonuclease, LAGLIDADG [Dillenia turbinata]|uniref:Homing endonuclease, LAGLIDADG n=1 Tax=Dillenia turbinata TaxID=194707 RepID=A0AAN8Z0P7_9MAGN
MCSKDVVVEEAEKAWLKLVQSDGGPSSQSFEYKMEMYSKRLTDALISEFVTSGLNSPSFFYVMRMYSNMNFCHKLESAFSLCLEKCCPNGTIYNVYLDSLVKNGNVEKAEQIFSQMGTYGTIGVNGLSCNIILSGYLSCGENLKAEKIYELMCQKKYDVDPPLMEKIDHILSLSKEVAQKPISMKLSRDQGELLLGLLMGGLQIESDEERRNHSICFALSENLQTHIVLRRHTLSVPQMAGYCSDELPYQFSTRTHSYFGFYADQLWPRGKSVIPKVIKCS